MVSQKLAFLVGRNGVHSNNSWPTVTIIVPLLNLTSPSLGWSPSVRRQTCTESTNCARPSAQHGGAKMNETQPGPRSGSPSREKHNSHKM